MLGILLLVAQATEPLVPPDLSVAGLVLAGPRAAAVLRAEGRQRAVVVGDVLLGFRVAAIDAEGVWLEKDGARLRLAPGQRPASTSAAVAGPPPAATSASPASVAEPLSAGEPRVLARADLERRLAAEMPRLLAETSLLPVTEDGRIVGLALTRLPAEGLLVDLGLRAGDVLTEINGTAIDGLPALLALWPRLQSESLFSATVLRGGRLLRLGAQLN